MTQSGFGYDPILGTITAPDAVWDTYLHVKAHRPARVFRFSGLANRDSLEALFSGKVATGQFAVSTADSSPLATSPSNSNPNPDDLSVHEEPTDAQGRKRKSTNSTPL